MISIVIAGRNDDYGGDFLARLRTSARVLGALCSWLPADFELVVVDWNPPADRTPLCYAIDWRMLGMNVRVITVPADVHDAREGHENIALFEYVAKNVGIRRARGGFIVATNADDIFSRELVVRLRDEEGLCASSFYRVERGDVPRDLLMIGSPYEILSRCGRHVEKTHRWNGRDLFLEASGDFMMMSAAAWSCVGGYPEVAWNHHVDSYGVVDAQRAGLSQVVLGEALYHQEHDRTERNRRTFNVTWDPAVHFPRAANWGYGDHEFLTHEVRVS